MLYNYPWPKDELGVRDAVLSFTDRLQVRNEDQPEPRIWAFNHHTRAEIHLKQFTPSLWLRLWIIYIELCQIIWLWRMLKSDRCTVHRDFYVPVSMQHSSYISSTQKTLMLQCFFFSSSFFHFYCGWKSSRLSQLPGLWLTTAYSQDASVAGWALQHYTGELCGVWVKLQFCADEQHIGKQPPPLLSACYTTGSCSLSK